MLKFNFHPQKNVLSIARDKIHLGTMADLTGETKLTLSVKTLSLEEMHEIIQSWYHFQRQFNLTN